MMLILQYLRVERTLRQYFRAISTPVRPSPPVTRRPTMISPVDANDPSPIWRLYAHYYFPLSGILGMRSSTDYCYAFMLLIDYPLLIQLYYYCRLRICTFWALGLLRHRYIIMKPSSIPFSMSLWSFWLWLRLNAFAIMNIYYLPPN